MNAVLLALSILLAGTLPLLIVFNPPNASAQPDTGSISPSRYWGPFIGTRGAVQISVNKPGLAVRVEAPREFLTSVTAENDTSFIQTDITNDYYYVNVMDEANHWTYGARGNPSDGACYKPDFSIRDPNAPWCIEIWNYLNGSFLNFTAPKFVRLTNLDAPSVAGIYNFTLSVANQTNSIGYPDFVHAWNTTLFVPVSMSDNPGSITGLICDKDDLSNMCPPILAKGVAYARNVDTGQIARSYVDQRNGQFNLTGLVPGSYQVQASAGIFDGFAYSLSDPSTVIIVQKGSSVSVGKIPLSRAPQVCGSIQYRDSIGLVNLAHSLSDHRYLPALGFDVLNITVEATDAQGHVFRHRDVSLDEASDSFTILTGMGIKYVGTDPYGTEFAGLPSVAAGSYQLNVNVWISGYLQDTAEAVTVNSAPGLSGSGSCNFVAPNPVIMDTGGVISGTLQFWNTVTLETPHDAELSLDLGAATDALFGGNVLIQAYDHSGLLRGITVLNGTFPNGKTIYAGSNSIRFYVIGFTELFNRTWSGVWNEKDYGLAADTQGYSLNVFVRGYEQYASVTVSLSKGGNTTVTVRMTRGGAIQVSVFSYNNRFGTRALQALQFWRFLNLSIPVRARVYFYDSGGRTVGFVDVPMVEGVDGVGPNSFVVVFAGQNWSIREIWFYNFVPTHITTDTYSIKAFTLGYVQQGPVSTLAELSTLSRTTVPLLLGNEIDVTGPIYAEPNLFWHTPEHDHSIGQAYSTATGLAGAINANLTAGFPTLVMPLFGFGAMLQNAVFLGQGHFFYVGTDGTRFFDYGLDTGNYTVAIPEFGFNKHFMQLGAASTVNFPDLFQGQSRVLPVIAMARVIQGSLPDALVSGWVEGSSVRETVPLSWVTVEATNSTFIVSVPTMDGLYDGIGALNLPAGTYNVTFSVLFFKSQTQPFFSVNWNGTYPLLPPQGPLCPTAGIGGVCDPPSPPSSYAFAFTIYDNASGCSLIVADWGVRKT